MPADRFREDLRATWEVVVRPRATFARFGERHPTLAPWLVGSVLSAALTLLLLSVSQRAAAHLLQGSASPEIAESARASLERMKAISVAGAPLGLLLRWGLTALALWAPAVLLSARASYRAVLSIVAYSALPGIFGEGLDLAIAWTRGPEFTPGLVPVLSPATSLGAFLPTLEAAWPRALLDRITLFGLWGLGLWIVGLRQKLRLGWARAATAAAPTYALLVVMAASFDVITGSALETFPAP